MWNSTLVLLTLSCTSHEPRGRQIGSAWTVNRSHRSLARRPGLPWVGGQNAQGTESAPTARLILYVTYQRIDRARAETGKLKA